MIKEIERLIAGNQIFKKKFFNEKSTLYNELVEFGQKPQVMVIACCDSRVDPAALFNCQPGELFVVRNVANLVPPFEINHGYHGTSAALEFAVCFLQVKHIIILGHTQCGGIQSLVENPDAILNQEAHSFIGKWMELARPGYDRVISEKNPTSFQEKIALCEQYSLVNSLQNLATFSWISQRVQEGALLLHAWYFNLESGLVYTYDKDIDFFTPLDR
jgi:carbonic anhydrase